MIEARSAEGRLERLPALAADLVRLKVDVITATTLPALQALTAATTTIPIVMDGGRDPVATGLVTSLARPGGNVTGLTSVVGPELASKRPELLKEAVPRISRVAVLTSKGIWDYSASHMQAAARALGLTVFSVEAANPEQYAEALAAITQERADALLSTESALKFVHRRRIVEFAATRRLPAMYTYRESVEAGGPPGLRGECRRPGGARRHLRGQNPERRQARRSPYRAADDVRAGHQPEDREGAGPYHRAVGAGAGG